MKWLAAAFAIFIIFAIYLANTGTPNIFDDIVRSVPHGDKIGHFVLMGTLALLVNLAMGEHTFCRWRIGRWVILGGTTIVAVLVTLEEFSQIFIDNRTFNPLDLLADYLGMAVANFVACWRFRIVKENSAQSQSNGNSQTHE